MSTIMDDLNKIFSFKDAVKTVENILNLTRIERDAYGPNAEGFYVSWTMYHIVQSRVEVLEDVLSTLMSEAGVADNVLDHDERGVAL